MFFTSWGTLIVFEYDEDSSPNSNETDVGVSGEIGPLSDIRYLIFQMKRTKWPLSFEAQVGHKLYFIFSYSEHNL